MEESGNISDPESIESEPVPFIQNDETSYEVISKNDETSYEVISKNDETSYENLEKSKPKPVPRSKDHNENASESTPTELKVTDEAKPVPMDADKLHDMHAQLQYQNVTFNTYTSIKDIQRQRECDQPEAQSNWNTSQDKCAHAAEPEKDGEKHPENHISKSVSVYYEPMEYPQIQTTVKDNTTLKTSHENPATEQNVSDETSPQENSVAMTISNDQIHKDASLHASIPISQEGGVYDLEAMDVSIMIPEGAINDPTQSLQITELEKTTKVMTNEKLISKVYECKPHGLSFCEKLILKLPLDKEIGDSCSVVRLVYGADEDHLVYFPMDGKLPIYTKDCHYVLPDISWYIFNKYCFIMIDRFCLLSVGEGEESETCEETNGSQGIPNRTFENDDGTLADNQTAIAPSPPTNSTSQSTTQGHNVHMRKTVLGQGSHIDDVCANLFITPEVNNKGLQFIATLQLEKAKDPCEARRSLLVMDNKITQSENLIDLENWKHPKETKNVNLVNNILLVKFSIDNGSFQLADGAKNNVSLDINDMNRLPYQNFFIQPKDGIDALTGSEGCQISVQLQQEVETEAQVSQSMLCCLKKTPRSITEVLSESIPHIIAAEQIRECKEFYKKRNTYQDKNSEQVKQQDQPDTTDEANKYESMELESKGALVLAAAAPIPAVESTHQTATAVQTTRHRPRNRIICHGRDLERRALAKMNEENMLSTEFRDALQVDLATAMSELSDETVNEVASKIGIKFKSKLNSKLLIYGMLEDKSTTMELFVKLCQIFKDMEAEPCYTILKFQIEKERMRKNKSSISNHIRMSRIKSELFANETIFPQEKDDIDGLEENQKAEYLISNVILKADREDFGKFIQVLRDTNHNHVVDRIVI